MDGSDDHQDVIASGDDERDRWAQWRGWASRRTGAIAVAALAVGLVAGYLVPHRQSRPLTPSQPAAAPSSALPSSLAPISAAQSDVYPALTATGNRCAVQHGTSLQLGVEVANQSDHAVAVGRFHAVLPIGGLQATTASVGTCGALPAGSPASVTIPAGSTEWLTITFRVLVRCPQPLPVQFEVMYLDSGRPVMAQLDEFPDLGQVSYSGCPTAQ